MSFPFPIVNGIVLCLIGLTAGASLGQEEVKLEKIEASAIEKMIAGHKGRVVCVDVWADFCLPCKKLFPHLVKLHKEFAKEGLDCISVSVDLNDNLDGALNFLKKQNATFPNYILWDDEDNKDRLEPKFAHRAPPIIHVFDRDGKKIRTWEGGVKEDEVDKLIKELLKKK